MVFTSKNKRNIWDKVVRGKRVGVNSKISWAINLLFCPGLRWIVDFGDIKMSFLVLVDKLLLKCFSFFIFFFSKNQNKLKKKPKSCV